ncbi:MAG: ankyrin repeat domain-containing protein [Candidatus Micrarchaeota archaeon]|nr:ankyrin repeat domain-containing protein [Candidatus Micrarchaeota archaeon]
MDHTNLSKNSPQLNRKFASHVPINDTNRAIIIKKTFQALMDFNADKSTSPIKSENDFNDQDKLNKFLIWLIMTKKNDVTAHTLFNRIIELGADPNYQLNDPGISSEFLNYSALHIACAINNSPFARLLLVKGANPNLLINDDDKLIYNISPLFVALYTDSILAAQLAFFRTNPADISLLTETYSTEQEINQKIYNEVYEKVDGLFGSLMKKGDMNIIRFMGEKKLIELLGFYLHYRDRDNAKLASYFIGEVQKFQQTNKNTSSY